MTLTTLPPRLAPCRETSLASSGETKRSNASFKRARKRRFARESAILSAHARARFRFSSEKYVLLPSMCVGIQNEISPIFSPCAVSGRQKLSMDFPSPTWLHAFMPTPTNGYGRRRASPCSRISKSSSKTAKCARMGPRHLLLASHDPLSP